MRDAAIRLLRALDAGELDADDRRLGARGAVLRALALARAGLCDQARLALSGLKDISADPTLGLAAAAVLHATRDYQRALDVLDATRRSSPAATRATARRVVAYASALGWEREVAAAIDLGRAAEPADPVWDVFEAQLHLRGGDLERAIVAARRARERAPGSAKLRIELATMLARRGDVDATAAEVAEALRLAPPTDAALFRRAAMWTLLDAGDLAAAFRHGEAALAADPTDAAVVLALADLSLWQGDSPGALRRAAAAPGPQGQAGALRIRGQIALATGSIEHALADLSAAIALHDTADARLSLAEALIRRRAWEPAHDALSRATAIGDGYLFVAWILRFLAAAGERPAADAPVHLRQIEEFAETLAEIAPDGAAALADGRQAPLVAASEQALARMGCNRSAFATYHDGHVLRRVSTRTGVRHASRQALQAIRSEPLDRVLALFDAALARWPRSSLPLAHRGELFLWLGDDARARADLEGALAISDRTRWAYVGLTLLSARTGDPAGALAISERGIAAMRGTVGPAVHAHRAGARRQLGDLAGALDDLRRAVALHPTRIGAVVELALTLAALGDLPGLAATFDDLRARAPGLVSDAAAELGLHAWRDRYEPPSLDERLRIVTQAHALLRGNRSSTCVTYVTAAGTVRTVPHGPAPPSRDAADLAGARALVLRTLGV